MANLLSNPSTWLIKMIDSIKERKHFGSVYGVWTSMNVLRSICGALPWTPSLEAIQMQVFALYVTSGSIIVPLFRNCTFTGTAWRESIWDVTQSSFPKHSNVSFDLIDFICSPPNPSLDNKSKLSLFLFGATLILNLWNEILHVIHSNKNSSWSTFFLI